MRVTDIACLAVVLASIVKLADGVALMRRMIVTTGTSERNRLDAPVFEWAGRQVRGVQRTVNLVFRAPVMVAVQTGVIFLSSSATPFLLVAAAILTVPVALNIVGVLLLGTVLERRRDTPVYAVSGLHYRRIGASTRTAENSIDPLTTVGLSAAAFLLAFSALYFALSVANHHAFRVALAGPTVPTALTPFQSVYFSVVTAATVGFGDISPVSQAAQCVVIAQILSTAAAVTFFVAYLLRERSTNTTR